MPTIRVSNVISYYADKQTHFEVPGATALEGVQMAGGRDPENGQKMRRVPTVTCTHCRAFFVAGDSPPEK